MKLSKLLLTCLSLVAVSSAFQSPFKRPTILSSKLTSKLTSSKSVSQMESIVSNAKSLIKIDKERKETLATSSLAGLAVAMAMIPEAVAFSFVANVHPLTGLWTTVLLGFIAAGVGGRPGICSGASGACALAVASLGASHGPQYLAATAILSGMIEIGSGVLDLGKFIRLVPHPVMLGFINGIAALVGYKQIMKLAPVSITTTTGAATYFITALTVALVNLLPKVTKAVPPTLGAIIIATVIANGFGLPLATLRDMAGASTFAGGWQVLPKLGLPTIPFSIDTLKIVLPFALIHQTVGAIESLLCLQLVDGIMDDGKRGSTRRELTGQGIGNVVSGFFGGIGGCAMLGQCLINVQSGGGSSRWSGMSMALFMALGIVVGAPLLGRIPEASITGLMIAVCARTFNWSSLRLLNKIPRLDAFIIALVSYLTFTKDLAIAVVAGTIVSALGFAWKQSTNISASTNTVEGTKDYKLRGPLFFGSTQKFQELFSVKQDPANVVLDFSDSRVYDHSALESIQNLVEKYQEDGKTIVLRGLSKDCAELLENLNLDKVIERDDTTDPDYGVASKLYTQKKNKDDISN